MKPSSANFRHYLGSDGVRRKEWQVFCKCCDKDNLEAHHINSWAEFPEDRFILENGLTLCKICHKNYHDYEREVKKNG